MKKTILTVVVTVLCLVFSARAQQDYLISGTISNAADGRPISGANIKVSPFGALAVSDTLGKYRIRVAGARGTLVVSFTGFQRRELAFDAGNALVLNVALQPADNVLSEVAIVSTGYQQLPRERATGAFTSVDTRTLNRSVGINVLDRLEGLASGLLLNRGLTSASGNNPKFSVRGRSTLFASAEPLIVLDGFPYPGTLEQINPTDIRSIDLLKDAAAASIWGSRSGNGVIVITTKQGRRDQPLKVELNSSLTVSGKPDQFYLPQLSSAEYIGLEQFLFDKGYYDYDLSTGYLPVSAAVEVFSLRAQGKISSADSAARIAALGAADVRRDIDRYLSRRKVYQQYQLGLSGGSAQHHYYLSGGLDRNLENPVGDSYRRLSLNASNTYALLKDRLELSAAVNFSSAQTSSNASPYQPFSPYDRLAAEDGRALPVVFSQGTGIRLAYADTAGGGRLLDWHYRPLEEQRANNFLRNDQYRIQAGLRYQIFSGLSLTANYQYLNEKSVNTLDNDLERYATRNLINTYSALSGGTLIRAVPLGSVLSRGSNELVSKVARFQLNYNGRFGRDHELNAIAGLEGSDTRGTSSGQTFYGYDPETMANGNAGIDPMTFYPWYQEPYASGQIPTAPSMYGLTDIAQSFYGNAAYTYLGRYTLSASARRDESNLFGVKTNQKGVPLWSAGLAWQVSKEGFYPLGFLPVLKLRATYGYNGNVDKSVSGLLAVTSSAQLNEWGSAIARITRPANPALRWEKVKTWNLGLDFSALADRLGGSLDVYRKNAVDLIGNSPVAYQTGVDQFRGNSADLQTSGMDLLLNSRNLAGRLQWNTTFLLSYNADKVTGYKIKQSSNLNIVSGNYNNPLQGYPYTAIFSFPSAGLDGTGYPQGYLGGAVSKDYAKIRSILDPAQLSYHGPATPRYFGSLINTWSYLGFELSLNVTYKLDYVFRRLFVFNGNISDTRYQLSGYDQRWQQPGDELHTRIPVLSYPANTARNSFFQYSSDLVEKADHIRLQDIRLAYSLNERYLKWFKSASIFLYARNLGILWKATDQPLDPDYGSSMIPQPLSLALGLNLNF